MFVFKIGDMQFVNYHQCHVTESKTCNKGKSKNPLEIFKTLLPLS